MLRGQNAEKIVKKQIKAQEKGLFWGFPCTPLIKKKETVSISNTQSGKDQDPGIQDPEEELEVRKV